MRRATANVKDNICNKTEKEIRKLHTDSGTMFNVQPTNGIGLLSHPGTHV